jgi:diguanylate cyclase (GGDEF)-like protein
MSALHAECLPRSPRVPRSFGQYTLLTALAAAIALATLPLAHSWRVNRLSQLIVLGLFVLLAELLPVPVPHRGGLDNVTVSTAFAFALLLEFGAGPAILVYATSSVIADAIARTAPIKIAFNAAQYTLALIAGAAVLRIGGASTPVPMTAHELPLVIAAGAAVLLAGHVLAGAGAGLLARLPIGPYLREDWAFQLWIAGCPLALAPVLVVSARASLWLVPVAFVPMLAIYVGGRHAAGDRHRAYHDSLTGLPNRALMIERLGSALRTVDRAPTPIAVMILDLDDFKAINDTLGHQFGDMVLKHIAPRLQTAAGPDGMLARLGGDEFAVLLEGADEAEARRLGERLIQALDRPIDVQSFALHITASIGIACAPQHGRSIADLLRHADVALYCAKASESACEVYADARDDYSLDRLALTAQLRHGIERGELVVHYQPKVALTPGRTSAVEALVRWNHPQLGCIGPDGFIPLAEQAGLINKLTERVLEAALTQAAAWRFAGIDVRISVNVSMRNLLFQDLPGTIRALLERLDLPPGVLQLEITESRIAADVARARSVLSKLRAMGVTIAIDDFGTGFSSLSQLQQLPVDEIKIDRSFVMHMESDRNDAALVRSIIDLGRNLGLAVTAEGVETASVHHTLRELGCDFAQGFLLSRPLPADECARYLESISGQPVRTLQPAGVVNEGQAA